MSGREGFALITVMLVFLTGTSITLAMLARQQQDVQRCAAILDQMQAYQYALGAEELARQVLAEGAAAAAEADHPGQAWARLREGVPVERGSLTFTLEDLQGRFNLNTLISRNADQIQRFRHLLAALKIDAAVLPAILARIGAEQAPHPFSSIESLREADGLTAEHFARLAPHVAALPEGEPLLNVNTASDIMLRAYLPHEGDFSLLAARRARRGFVTSADLSSMGLNHRGMTVRSRFFLLSVQAQVQKSRVALTSVILREIDGGGTVLLRVIRRDLRRHF